jgi:hypothetical protein
VTNTPAKKNVSNAIAQVKTLQMLPKWKLKNAATKAPCIY